MVTRSTTVLVVGATGSIGSLVVAEALRQGYLTRALARNHARAAHIAPGAEVVVGDLTKVDNLTAAVEGVDAVIFAHGANGGKEQSEAVDYGAVRNVLAALDRYPARIVLMTTLGLTARDSEYNRATAAFDWKRRAERLVRASGRPYTIVRPGWFDYHAEDQHKLVMLQGDTRRTGGPADGTVSRQQVAQVLVHCIRSAAADRKTFELVAESGPAQKDLDPLFAGLRADEPGSLDGVLDEPNMPLEDEPARVRVDLRLAAEALRRI
ncbi:Uncharacterized conserved protein YbjT, contains NAD(P)-binding and DUF2867 domains [Raineyella antarctica]|uniref:Uncharacterized conserved protein YbjT, contains NAD(P)-binding and DUF2867 domains n=1 Tax=Raineyella antarctica TaxID=1577474 RepID=A0A1G6H782_9ACTN|nr:SDR family oxidoreductase [Raineyella antarctica]SDB90004.1 Uncharacterized conserved protein YbjT, contains NAD(P)-binding and DUF2867 domains [Raineyella antarctica]